MLKVKMAEKIKDVQMVKSLLEEIISKYYKDYVIEGDEQ